MGGAATKVADSGTNGAGAPRIAFVTIGQAPRPDILPEVLGMLDVAPVCEQFGALDGLSREEIGRHPTRPRERSLYTRLADGSHVVAHADFVEDRLQELIGRLDRRGYDLIVLISTGVFRPIATLTPLVHGQRALDAWIAALVMGDCRIGVIYPLDQQTRTSPRHGLLIQNARLAAATGEAGSLADAASRVKEADFVLMHSVGYTEAMARQVAVASGKPVVTARRIIAGSMRLHLRAASETMPARTGLSGHSLIERLPSPAQKLTRRERDVLSHVLEGHSNKAIGRVLGISHRTVEIHRSRAMAKFGTASATELVRWSMIGLAG
jgi:DNA-binding CsgD family transcriptional regulator